MTEPYRLRITASAGRTIQDIDLDVLRQTMTADLPQLLTALDSAASQS